LIQQNDKIMKTLKTNGMEDLKKLFVELVKAELSNYKKISENMVSNTIQFFSEMYPFNKVSIEEWYCICSANGIKYSI
jgi:hypothetical protein